MKSKSNKIKHRGDKLRFVGIILFNLVALCIVLFPFYWLITASIKPDKYIITNTFYLYPPEVTMDHFITVFKFGNFLHIFMNSAKVALSTVICSLIAIVPAAYALGACGVQVGTCLLASEECPIHDNYKQAIIKAKDTSTTVTGRIAGTPVRIIKNKMAKEYIKREKEGADMMELEKYTLGSLKRAVLEGDVDTGSLMAGQVAGMVNEIKPVATIIKELFDDCNQEFKRLESEF